MACFHPLKGYRSRSVNATGSRSIVFNVVDGFADLPVVVPCGQCAGCRLERSRQWAVRCMHEASLHEDNCFITLTYDDLHLPPGRSLVVSDFQKFMKRLRKRVGKVRFFQCGEYGERYGRPHYHACLFGFDFPDKEPVGTGGAGHVIYSSAILAELWPQGLSSVGAVTWESAAYVARYVMKKVTGDAAEAHYEYVDDYGVVHNRTPDYVTMSRRPGIAAAWFDRFSGDAYPSDFLVMNGAKFRPPRFYDNLFELVDPVAMRRVKGRRVRKAARHAENNTPDRLAVREKVQLSRVKRLKREVE